MSIYSAASKTWGVPARFESGVLGVGGIALDVTDVAVDVDGAQTSFLCGRKAPCRRAGIWEDRDGLPPPRLPAARLVISVWTSTVPAMRLLSRAKSL